LPVTLVLLSVGLVLAWRFVPLSAAHLVAIYVACVALVVGGALSRAFQAAYRAEGSAFEEVRRTGGSTSGRRPRELEAIERTVVASRTTASEVHLALRPLLRRIAVPGLEGATDETGTARARREAAIDAAWLARRGSWSPLLWELVRPGRPRPESWNDEGVSAAALREVVDELEERQHDA
jgi:hypothetical protein